MRSSPPTSRRAATVLGWLVVGVACGLAMGFLAGLARPRPNSHDVGPMGTDSDPSHPRSWGPSPSGPSA